MATYNYARTQLTANRLITKYGRNAVLRRGTTDRKIKCVLIDYTTNERRANPLIQAADQKALISAVNLIIPPDLEEDVLVIGAGVAFKAPFETWRIIAPPSKLDPAGTIVYWEAQLRK